MPYNVHKGLKSSGGFSEEETVLWSQVLMDFLHPVTQKIFEHILGNSELVMNMWQACVKYANTFVIQRFTRGRRWKCWKLFRSVGAFFLNFLPLLLFKRYFCGTRITRNLLFIIENNVSNIWLQNTFFGETFSWLDGWCQKKDTLG